MNFEKRSNRSLEDGPEPIPDREDDGFPDTMPEEPEVNPNFDINPEEHLIQEDEIEEIHKKKSGDATPMPEKIMGDTDINSRIIEAQSTVNKLKQEIAITTDQKKKEILEEFLKDAKSELEKWLNYR